VTPVVWQWITSPIRFASQKTFPTFIATRVIKGCVPRNRSRSILPKETAKEA
jgi:hypothetical protein